MKVLIIICAILVFISIFLSWVLVNLLKENTNLEKENKKKNEQAERTAEVITEANKTKADARTGNHSDDINYMADKLHHYANK